MSSQPSRPEVRAPVTKAILELLEEQPARVRDAVREKAAAAVRLVEDASRVSWIPLSEQLRILSALRDEVGLESYEDFCAAHFSSTAEQPLIKPVLEGTVRLFGMGPGPVLRMFPKSWRMISRGCGVVHVEGDADASEASIRVVDLPIDEEEIDLFVTGFRATFRGVLDLFETEGDVELISFDRRRREATYRARWG